MMYSEFIEETKAANLIFERNHPLPTADYYSHVIEVIYNYHPLNLTHKEMGFLYAIGGKSLMRDLLELAVDFRDLESDVDEARTRLNEAQQDLEHRREAYHVK